jgi:RAB protein geranylgeranyltransferase component A
MITDLLAACAYGESAGVDAICCTIYTEEELIEIISSDSISIYRKRPFMKLLVWVYMNVHGDKAEERSYHYRKNRYSELFVFS